MLRDNSRMSRQQLFNRIAPDVIARVLREWNDGSISAQAATAALDVSRPQLYRLKTKWLAQGKTDVLLTGVSGGDHSADWPSECVEHLERMLLASGGHGPNYELYADELERKFGFRRDRSNVRKYCESHFAKLLHRVFPVERRPEEHMRRWARENFGELVQHDSTPLHLWGEAGSRQSIIISKDDATRNVLACRVCERETVVQHFAALEQMIAHVGVPEELYTDGFTMFGAAGVDLKTQFGRACRALGILHGIAPTPQAKGKIERDMRTFRHRLAVVFRTEGVADESHANEVAFEHYRHWNAKHVHRELGCTPHEARTRCCELGHTRMKVPPAFKKVKLFLSLRERRKVELGGRIDFDGRRWSIARTSRKTVVLAVRPVQREFYVLEDDLDPTSEGLPRTLAKYEY